jgi:FMN phosphatase YigB (HAD superfamily)
MKVKTVLFDIGGVLSHDGHETYLTHDRYGLVRNLNSSKQDIFKKTAPIFRKYAVSPKAMEVDFWNDISKVLDAKFSKEDIKEVKQKIQDTNHEAQAVFKLLESRGIAIGVISNSTSFFYPVMAKSLSLSEHIRPSLYFLSYKEGLLKSNGLFEFASTKLNPSQTFIVDDRSKNVDHSLKLGFNAAQYSMENDKSLLELVKDIIA